MKRSVASVLAERRKERQAVKPTPIKVRHVKFSPEEMAYDAAEDVSDSKRFVTVARGRKEWEQYLSFRRGFVKLDPDVRRAFPDDRSVNEVLKKVIELRSITIEKRTRSTKK
jgi:hypothetical protein